MIQRGPQTIAVPSGDTRIFPGDTIGVIGTDDQISAVLPDLEAGQELAPTGPAPEFRLTSVVLTATSPLIGETLATAEVRRRYHTHVVGIERGGEFLEHPAAERLRPGDRLWTVGPAGHAAAMK